MCDWLFISKGLFQFQMPALLVLHVCESGMALSVYENPNYYLGRGNDVSVLD